MTPGAASASIWPAPAAAAATGTSADRPAQRKGRPSGSDGRRGPAATAGRASGRLGAATAGARASQVTPRWRLAGGPLDGRGSRARAAAAPRSQPRWAAVAGARAGPARPAVLPHGHCKPGEFQSLWCRCARSLQVWASLVVRQGLRTHAALGTTGREQSRARPPRAPAQRGAAPGAARAGTCACAWRRGPRRGKLLRAGQLRRGHVERQLLGRARRERALALLACARAGRCRESLAGCAAANRNPGTGDFAAF